MLSRSHAGFTKREESEYDPFGAGHSSTSISAGLGMAVGRDIKGKKNHVVAIIGDGAITGGMAYEAMNHAGFLDKNMIVILNDNQQVGWRGITGNSWGDMQFKQQVTGCGHAHAAQTTRFSTFELGLMCDVSSLRIAGLSSHPVQQQEPGPCGCAVQRAVQAAGQQAAA